MRPCPCIADSLLRRGAFRAVVSGAAAGSAARRRPPPSESARDVRAQRLHGCGERIAPCRPDVAEKAKHHILDTFAAMVSGSGASCRAAPRWHWPARKAGRAVATVVGSNVLTGPMDAALVNGVLAHSDETDDSHGPSQSHPWCVDRARGVCARRRSGCQR
jgi:hypothetical protein